MYDPSDLPPSPMYPAVQTLYDTISILCLLHHKSVCVLNDIDTSVHGLIDEPDVPAYVRSVFDLDYYPDSGHSIAELCHVLAVVSKSTAEQIDEVKRRRRR